jgi:sensor c-di-GMP phosphodiesterase-like protein
MAHAMNLDVVAEGLNILNNSRIAEAGLRLYQGWHCSPALVPNRFRALLAGTGTPQG